MKIVILEDEIITAMFLKDTVNELLGEHTVTNTFDEAKSLLNYLKDNKTDIIFMDIKLNAQEDGIEIAYKVKNLYPSISIVFITAYKDSKTIQRAALASPLGYLTKPIIESDIEAILMVAESSLNKSQDIYSITPYTYNIISKELCYNSTRINLTTNEEICLESLIKDKNNYVKQESLVQNIWENESNRITSLRELVYRLRKKLPLIEIKNISKKGYMLEVS